MKPYPSYKESGVEWMGDIPSGWTPIRNKLLFTITKNLVGESSSDYQLLSLTKKGIILRDMESGKGKFPEKFDTYQAVGKNNLVFCLFDIDETPRTIGLSTYDGMITGSYTVVMCKEGVDPKFVYYNYLSIDDVKGLKPYYTGLRKVVRTETFLGLKVQTPPLQEQQQIANYLDQKTQLIDSLMAKTQQKIALLKEQRTAQINQAVTKGLNPGVEMQDSGVEWLGEIPSGWDSVSLRPLVTKIGSGSTPRGGGENYPDQGITFLRSQNVHFDGLRLDNVVFISPETHSQMSGSSVQRDDLLLNITGGSIGRCCVVDSDLEMNVNQHVSIIRTTQKLTPDFLNYVLSSDIGQEQVEYNQTGGNREGLTSDNIKNFKIGLPLLQEQKEIADYLDHKTQLIDSLIEKEIQRINLLKEYRKSLISNVVTGKIDVRKEEKTA